MVIYLIIEKQSIFFYSLNANRKKKLVDSLTCYFQNFDFS